MFSRLGLSSVPPKSPSKSERILAEPTLTSVCEAIKSGKFRNVVVMSGAGISTAAGIPDFRSPSTGLYHKLEKYNLPYPEAIFALDYFKQNPKPFYTLAKELFPGEFQPTNCHYLIRLLNEKGLLLRNYSQNIDGLEEIGGVPPKKIVYSHGSFSNSTCLKCRQNHSTDFVKEAVFADKIPTCSCGGVVKPDITFFGEGLPERFWDLVDDDFVECDLLLIMGTSLQVEPFASLIRKVHWTTPRVLINNHETRAGFLFGHEDNFRDVPAIGDCQETVLKMVELLDWTKQFNEIVEQNKNQQKPNE